MCRVEGWFRVAGLRVHAKGGGGGGGRGQGGSGRGGGGGRGGADGPAQGGWGGWGMVGGGAGLGVGVWVGFWCGGPTVRFQIPIAYWGGPNMALGLDLDGACSDNLDTYGPRPRRICVELKKPVIFP